MDFNITTPFHCSLPVQLRFSDFDTLGHVNNPVYLNLFDVGKSDYFERAAGAAKHYHKRNQVRVRASDGIPRSRNPHFSSTATALARLLRHFRRSRNVVHD